MLPVHLGVSRVSTCEQTGPHPKEDGYSHRGAATIGVFQGRRNEVDGTPPSDSKRCPSIPGKLPDVPEGQGADVELLGAKRLCERQIFATLSDVLQPAEH